MTRSKLYISCVLSILIVSVSSAGYIEITGDPVPISSIPAEGLVVGDKLFSEFGFFGYSAGGALTPSEDTVYVQGVQDEETGDYGLRFLLSWQAASEQVISVPSLNFKVSVLPGGEDLNGASMILAMASATGDGCVNAGETIWDGQLPSGSILASLDCSKEPGDGNAYLKAAAEFALAREIWVRKGISVTGGQNGTAYLSELFQFYSQIPEPATVLLLGLGALVLMRKRKG